MRLRAGTAGSKGGTGHLRQVVRRRGGGGGLQFQRPGAEAMRLVQAAQGAERGAEDVAELEMLAAAVQRGLGVGDGVFPGAGLEPREHAVIGAVAVGREQRGGEVAPADRAGVVGAAQEEEAEQFGDLALQAGGGGLREPGFQRGDVIGEAVAAHAVEHREEAARRLRSVVQRCVGHCKKTVTTVIPLTVAASRPVHKPCNATDPQERFAAMHTTTTASISSLRTEMRRVAYGPLMPRLWHRMCREWQYAADRSAARAVQSMDHQGVLDDYQMAALRRR